jgi:Zn-dependent protease
MPEESGIPAQNTIFSDARPTTDSEVEAEIRRQILAERAASLQGSVNTSVSPPTPYTPVGGNQAADTPAPGLLHRWKQSGGILGGLASLLLLLAKLKSLLFAFKFFGILKTLLITGGSMFVSMWAYASSGGWAFGVVFVLMIFIHECGHAFAGHLRGKPWGIMMFIPLMGAFVTIRGGKNAVEDAFIGIAGPIVGTMAGLGAVLIYGITKNPFWLGMAYVCFWMNLFNLLPVAPLDGGWIVPLFSSRILAITAVLLLPLTYFNPLIILLAAASLPRIIAGWNAGKNNPKIPLEKQQADLAYFQVTRAEQWRYGMAYVGLIAFLATAAYFTHDHTNTHHPRPKTVPLQISI